MDLVNTCWLNVDQNFIFQKYGISAFKCRINRLHIFFIGEDSMRWTSVIFMSIFMWPIFSILFWKVKNGKIHNFRQLLLTTCVWYQYDDYGGSQRFIWSLFLPNIMVANPIAVSGGGKNWIFFPTEGRWNNYLQITKIMRFFTKVKNVSIYNLESKNIFWFSDFVFDPFL